MTELHIPHIRACNSYFVYIIDEIETDILTLK